MNQYEAGGKISFIRMARRDFLALEKLIKDEVLKGNPGLSEDYKLNLQFSGASTKSAALESFLFADYQGFDTELREVRMTAMSWSPGRHDEITKYIAVAVDMLTRKVEFSIEGVEQIWVLGIRTRFLEFFEKRTDDRWLLNVFKGLFVLAFLASAIVVLTSVDSSANTVAGGMIFVLILNLVLFLTVDDLVEKYTIPKLVLFDEQVPKVNWGRRNFAMQGVGIVIALGSLAVSVIALL